MLWHCWNWWRSRTWSFLPFQEGHKKQKNQLIGTFWSSDRLMSLDITCSSCFKSWVKPCPQSLTSLEVRFHRETGSWLWQQGIANVFFSFVKKRTKKEFLALLILEYHPFDNPWIWCLWRSPCCKVLELVCSEKGMKYKNISYFHLPSLHLPTADRSFLCFWMRKMPACVFKCFQASIWCCLL